MTSFKRISNIFCTAEVIKDEKVFFLRNEKDVILIRTRLSKISKFKFFPFCTQKLHKKLLDSTKPYLLTAVILMEKPTNENVSTRRRTEGVQVM